MGSRYGIKIMLAKDDWIYVTESSNTNVFDFKPKLFNTRERAEEFADSWRIKGKEAFVKVVRYRGE